MFRLQPTPVRGRWGDDIYVQEKFVSQTAVEENFFLWSSGTDYLMEDNNLQDVSALLFTTTEPESR